MLQWQNNRLALFLFQTVFFLTHVVQANSEHEQAHHSKAVEPAAAHKAIQPSYVDLPSGCFVREKFPCSLRTYADGLIVEKKDYRIVLKPSTVISWKSGRHLRFVSGDVWLESRQSLMLDMNSRLSVEFIGQVTLSSVYEPGQLRLQNMSASEIHFKSEDLLVSESVPVGFENWYSILASGGELQRGVMKPIDKIGFFKNWMSVAVLSPAELKKNFKYFSSLWRGNVEQAAEYYQKIIERRIATYQEIQENKKQEKIHKKNQQEKIRKLYREKNFLNE